MNPVKLLPETTLGPASLARRLLAIAYDSLLVIAVLMFTTAVYMGVKALIIGTESYRLQNEQGSTIGDPLLTAALFLALYGFFGWFWTRNGQTLGMQVWHIRVQTAAGDRITWGQALLRCLGAAVSTACLGMGYWWMLFDRDKKTWHCRLSGTEIARIPKPGK